MQPQEYVEAAIRTESPVDQAMRERVYASIRHQHAIDGMTTEVGELSDVFKRFKYYGTEIDWTNVEEEIGDLMWYVALLCDACKFDLGAIMQKNINKLKARYPEKFDSQKAVNRDLDAERKVLEGE